LFPSGGAIAIQDLIKAGLVRKGQPVKVLGFGEISVKVDVTAHKFSQSATSKITSAGGSIKVF
jgi:large subunit ribosomal protein L15